MSFSVQYQPYDQHYPAYSFAARSLNSETSIQAYLGRYPIIEAGVLAALYG
jgi:hypothetical protein